MSGMARNMAWRYLSQATSLTGGLVVVAYSLRRLGPSRYGWFALVSTVFGLLGTVDFGLTFSVVRAVARDNERDGADEAAAARREVEVAHATYAALGAVSLVGSGLVAIVLPDIETAHSVALGQLRLTVILVGLALALSLGTSTFAGIPTGRQRFAIPSISLITGSITNVLVVVLALPSLGLVALGWGELAGVLVGQVACVAWLRRYERWFRLFPRGATLAEVRTVAVFAAPLLVLSIGGQVIATTDLLVVGAVTAAGAVALYKVGSLIPTQLVSTLYLGYDTVYPSLSGERDPRAQERMTALLSRVLSFVAGMTFGVLVLLRQDVVQLFVGHPSSLAQELVVLFSITWCANVPVHGLALLLISRGRQGVFVGLVAGEAVANTGLTVLLGILLGAVGPAIATLATLAVSNVLLFPLLIRRELERSPYRWLAQGFGAMALGLSGALAGAGTATLILRAGTTRLVSGSAFTACVGLAGGLLLLGRSGRANLATLLRRAETPSARRIPGLPSLLETTPEIAPPRVP